MLRLAEVIWQCCIDLCLEGNMSGLLIVVTVSSVAVVASLGISNSRIPIQSDAVYAWRTCGLWNL